jgi:hypothetical protein
MTTSDGRAVLRRDTQHIVTLGNLGLVDRASDMVSGEGECSVLPAPGYASSHPATLRVAAEPSRGRPMGVESPIVAVACRHQRSSARYEACTGDRL